MLNRQKVAELTELQRQSLRDAFDTYEQKKDSQTLCSNISRLGILFIPPCCGLSVTQQADWVKYLIHYNFNPPL